MFTLLYSIVPRLHYEMMTHVQKVTVFSSGCSQSNVSAGERGTGEEG